MILFSLLNRVFDLGSEMAMSHNLGIPTTRRDIFIQLQKGGLIGEELTGEMTGLVTYRNLLSHEYHGIDEKKLFSLTRKTGSVKEFVHVMQKIIQDNSCR